MTNGLPDTRDQGSVLCAALSGTEALYALDIAKIGVWTRSFVDDGETATTALYDLFGVDRDGGFDMQRVISHAVHVDDRDLLSDALVAARNPSGQGGFELEVRVVRQDRSINWLTVTGRAEFVAEANDRSASKFTAVFRDITDQKEEEARNRLLIDGLNHRIKSVLTLVQGVAHQTFRRDVGSSGLFTDFQGRLRALGKAHDLLVEQRFLGTFFEPLAERILGSCGAPFNRVTMSGFPLHLGSKQAVSLSIVLHELSVNALKYGAFSLPSGRVDLTWSHNDLSDMVRIKWVEKDGPPVIEPASKGFGSRMVERAIALEFGGAVTMSFAPEGLTCVMTIPLKSFDQNGNG